MPTLPWTPIDQPEPDASLLVLGSRLELRSYRDVPGFLRVSMKIRKQVRASRGAFGVSLIAQPARKTFWTLSAWSDEGAMHQFVRTEPHRSVMSKYHDRLADPQFVTWTEPARELPKPYSNAKALWRTAREKLARAKSGVSR
jgi:hypothetical protein